MTKYYLGTDSVGLPQIAEVEATGEIHLGQAMIDAIEWGEL